MYDHKYKLCIYLYRVLSLYVDSEKWSKFLSGMIWIVHLIVLVYIYNFCERRTDYDITLESRFTHSYSYSFHKLYIFWSSVLIERQKLLCLFYLLKLFRSVSTPRKHLWRKGLRMWEDGAVSDGSGQAGNIRYSVISAFRGPFV